MEQKNGSKKLIDADALWMDVIHSMDYCDDILEIIERQPAVEPLNKESVLDIYSDLYDVFDDSPGIINELHKVYDRLNALGSDQHPGEWHREVLGSTSGYGTTVMYQCSGCGSMSISQYKYCPNCGKSMLKEDNK